MLPTRSLGLLALVVFAVCIFALSFMAFAPPAFAVSQDGRPYRGYADICVYSSPMACGSAQTRAVFDTRAQCERAVTDAMAEYRKHIAVLVAAEVQCRYDPDLYDA